MCEEEWDLRIPAFEARGNKFTEESMQAYLEFHKEHPYCKKNQDRTLSKQLITDASFVHKEKRRLILLKLGIDNCTLIWRVNARVWGQGPDAIVMHECMSASMLNFQQSRVLSMLVGTKRDLFNPDIELDYFNRHHLERNLYWFEKVFEKMLLKDLGDCDISALCLNSPASDVEVIQLQDIVEDARFVVDSLGFENRNLEDWLLSRTDDCPLYMTPQFLQHFELEGIISMTTLIWKVNYLSLQCGFYLQNFAKGEMN